MIRRRKGPAARAGDLIWRSLKGRLVLTAGFAALIAGPKAAQGQGPILASLAVLLGVLLLLFWLWMRRPRRWRPPAGGPDGRMIRRRRP